MKKIKIGFFASDNAGVGHYRTIWAGQQLHRSHGAEFDVTIGHNTVDYSNVEYFKQFDIIHFHRHLGPFEIQEKVLPEIRKAGVITIVDIDDYWSPPPTHPMYLAAKREKIAEKTVDTFTQVDHVTTTTNIFSSHIKKYNKSVFIIPNAIDLSHRMWADEDTRKTDKLRIAWIGGSSHLHDLELVKPSFNILNNDASLRDQYQIVMCGYDVRGTITHVSEDGTREITKKIEPHETVWNKFEEIFTTNYNPNVIDPDYKNYLQKYRNEPYKGGDVLEKNYVRRWTLPLTQYGTHYNYCDVCLAPIDNNTFNEVKSELKIIEAGMKKKALIAQDFGIYRELLKDGETGLLVSRKDSRGWYEAMKSLIKNRDLVDTLANNLHEFVKDKYSLKNITESRAELYRKLYAEKAVLNTEIESVKA